VVVDPVRDMRGSPAVVHEHWGDNLYLERTIEGGDIEAARAAEVTVTRHYRMNRQSGAPLEGRAVLAYREPTRLARPYHRATAARKSGSQVTPRWREMDSNFWYRGTKAVDFRSIPGIAGVSAGLLNDTT
jgi:hypothetical protein